jgi:hypothetical protein
MTKRYLSGCLALVWVAALTGCNEAETPESCIERFTKVLGDSPALPDARFQPIFTYDVTKMEDALETLYGDGAGAAGARMTISHGPSGAALDAFYKADVPPKGAMFAGDGFSLYRIKGQVGSRDDTLAAGCRDAPPKARLIHIQWIALAPGTETTPQAAGARI